MIDFEKFLNTEIDHNIKNKNNEHAKPEITFEKDDTPDKVEE